MPRAFGDLLGPGDDLFDLLGMQRFGRLLLPYPRIGAERLVELGMARKSRASDDLVDHRSVQFQPKQIGKRAHRRHRSRHQRLAVEHPHPLRPEFAHQQRKQMMLSKPASRRNLEVGLSEILRLVEAEIYHAVLQQRDEELAHPQATPHSLFRDRGEIDAQRRMEQQALVSGRIPSTARAMPLTMLEGFTTTASPGEKGWASKVIALSSISTTRAGSPPRRRQPTISLRMTGSFNAIDTPGRSSARASRVEQQ